MSRFKRDKRGQFVILAAVIIAGFLLSLVLTISHLSTSRLEVAYEPVDEVVLAIASDFERCLTRALAAATQSYSENYDISLAEMSGKRFIDDWLRVLLESYGGFGINVILAPENGAGRSIAWVIEWGKGKGISMAYTTFGMNIEAYGLKNLVITMQRMLYLEILDAKVELNSASKVIKIIFRVYLGGKKEYFIPVSGLTRDNIKLLVNGVKEIRIMNLEYLNQGIYRAMFDFDDPIAEYVTLIVTDNDGIMVAASLGLCTLLFESDDLSTQGIDNGGNFIINGATVNPQYKLSLFVSQTLAVSFIPPEGSEFRYFSTSGPVSISTAQDQVTAIIKVNDCGHAIITACYGSLSSPRETCNIDFRSREYGNAAFSNLGSITLTYPDGTSHTFTLPGSVLVPYDVPIKIEYNPEPGYLFRSWELNPVSAVIMVDSSSSPSIFRAISDGTIIAVYEKSRPEKWQVIYLAPIKGKDKELRKTEDFLLTIGYINETDITPRFNKPHDSRKGVTVETTPIDLLLGERITIIIWAKYTKEGKEKDDYIEVKFTLGYIDSNGVLYEIGSNTAKIGKSPGHPPEQPPIYISPNVNIIPAGSKIVLIIERLDEGEGTLHIDCGEGKSRIILW